MPSVITPVVLAAGRSTRMGRPKPLLPDREGRPFVARIVRTLGAAGLDDVVVVTGETHDLVVAALEADQPPVLWECRRNSDPDRGQLSSLRAGLDVAEERGAEAVLVHLVDIPLVKAETVRAVIDGWRASTALIARPAIGDKHGHPVLFARDAWSDLRRAALDTGAKPVIQKLGEAVANVEVDDPGCLRDIDTPRHYAAV
jgi:molybdenum cofactor cytidylyltransferase